MIESKEIKPKSKSQYRRLKAQGANVVMSEENHGHPKNSRPHVVVYPKGDIAPDTKPLVCVSMPCPPECKHTDEVAHDILGILTELAELREFKRRARDEMRLRARLLYNAGHKFQGEYSVIRELALTLNINLQGEGDSDE